MKPFTPARPDATTIAEEMSGFPGLMHQQRWRAGDLIIALQMGAPDLWIKTLERKNDEDWDLGN